MQKRQSLRCTQCPNSLTRFHSLLQVNYMSGLMKGIVNEGIGGDFGYSQGLTCFYLIIRFERIVWYEWLIK